MLHPTNLPDCEPILQRILDFQEKLLAFACSHSTLLRADLNQEFGAQVSDWLHQSPTRNLLLDPLKQFAQQPQTDKDAVLSDFRYDRQYPQSKDDPSFKFRLRPSTSLRTEIVKWCIYFYTQFAEKNGFHVVICQHGSTGFHKKQWHESFRKTNPKQLTCSVCDGTMNQGTTVEHYFAKSEYPALSVHPHNLLPLCGKCNNDKGNKDTLVGRDITQVFLPYHRDIRSGTRLTFTANSTGTKIQFTPQPSDSNTPDRILALSSLFNIPERWQSGVDEISEIGWSKLRDQVEMLRESGVIISTETMKSVVAKTCDQMERDWGKFHYYYPATEWLRWAMDSKYDLLCEQLL